MVYIVTSLYLALNTTTAMTHYDADDTHIYIIIIIINPNKHYIYPIYTVLERITRCKPFNNFEYFIQQAMILHVTGIHRFAISALQ